MKIITYTLFFFMISATLNAQIMTEDFENELLGGTSFSINNLNFTTTGDLIISEFNGFSCDGASGLNRYLDSGYLDGASSGVIGSIVAPDGYTFQLASVADTQCGWTGTNDGDNYSTGTIRFTGKTIYNYTISEEFTITSTSNTNFETFSYDYFIWDGMELISLELEIINGMDYWAMDNLMVKSITPIESCTIGDNYNTYYSNPQICGQSFTANCTGSLNYVQFNVHPAAGVLSASTLYIYDGNTTSGTPIYTQNFPDITVASQERKARIDISGNVPLIENNQYTFVFDIGNLIPQGTAPSPFPEGNAFWDGVIKPNHDFGFKVSITDESLSVNTYNSLSNIKLYPNPTSDFICVSNVLDNKNYSIYDITGKKVSSGQLNKDSKITVKKLQNGLYFLTIDNHQSLKFIKQ
ncbi:T9SS type A sorting domain-containing protein [Olleya sp. YS]|uniref:T9SS type A sorting domain-containing protein n=1 Tax=Olleya sp. YS TaxID=3028318 RepID=UPI0024342E91|nr:T9SS type A sorting domain-containing protein [Olleya sp. YS]WGD34044.1 T9SS type A sorting domain-containing protein [Olleya sp. YS]